MMRPHTNRLRVSWSRTLPILRSRRRWKKQVDITLVIYWCMDNELSRMTPRSRTRSDSCITAWPTRTETSVLARCSRLTWDPSHISSVLVGFNWVYIWLHRLQWLQNQLARGLESAPMYIITATTTFSTLATSWATYSVQDRLTYL